MAFLDILRQDVRYALRGIRRSPVFTITVIATLGLGLGANAAMFNVVDRLMFRPLAYLRDPDSVHRIYWQTDNRGTTNTQLTTYYTRYLDLKRWTRSFDALAAFSERDIAVGDGELARERRVGAVSASFFSFFDARPALGRFFTPQEDTPPRGADVAVISHAMWQSDFGGRDVRGESLRVGNVRATIIGVAPQGFDGVNDANPPVVYLPITTFAGSGGTDDSKTYFTKYNWGWVNVIVRRAPSVTIAQATADATQAFRRSYLAGRAAEPSTPPPEATRPRVVVSAVRPGAGPDPALEARTALWVSIVAVVVLVIAVANVANLFVARGIRRRRETTVRLALGVSRSRLIGQAVTESLVLSLLGALTALVVAQWAGAAIRRLLIDRAAPSPSVFTDWRTLGATVALAIVVGVLVGAIPTLSADRGDLAHTLRGGARGGVSEKARLRGVLLVMQAALSVALLIGAALFVRSLGAVKSMRIGYDADRVLLVNRVIQGASFNDSTQRVLRTRLLETAQALPGVEAAAWVSSAPFVSTSNTTLYVVGIDSVARLGTFTYQATTPDYFRAMSTRILRGRSLSAEDRAGAPNVAVVSESMARVLWPGQDALGKCFRIRADTAPCTTVVGIAEDMVQRDLAGTQRFHYYLSADQFTRTWGNGLVLRMRGNPAVAAEPVRRALQRVVPPPSYVMVQPLGDIVAGAQRAWRLGATMFVAFGLLALVVAAVGLYGMIGFNVAQRMHELGVRVALGAQRGNVVALVVRQSVAFALAGGMLGVLVAFIGGRWIEPLLFRQSATSPAIYAAVTVTMCAVALAASVVPAWRAARADPIVALRSD
jgi:putative ABC transport system permease protein